MIMRMCVTMRMRTMIMRAPRQVDESHLLLMEPAGFVAVKALAMLAAMAGDARCEEHGHEEAGHGRGPRKIEMPRAAGLARVRGNSLARAGGSANSGRTGHPLTLHPRVRRHVRSASLESSHMAHHFVPGSR